MKILTIGFFLLSSVVCGERLEIVRQLETQYKEYLSAIGIFNNNVIELYVSEKGSWTLLTTMPSGISCISLVGDNWETIPKPEDPSL